MSTARWVPVSVLLCAEALTPTIAFGQTTGEIRGTAKDQTGAVVPLAKVTATLQGTETARSVTTDNDGAFEIPELQVGGYTVTAEAQGFKKFVANNVAVSIGHVALVDVLFQVGATFETVVVQANSAQVETTSTQLGAVMSEMAVRELPLSTRNTYQLLQMQPGVQSQLGSDLFYGSDNPGAVSVNGGRGRSNNYMVNGGDGNDIFVNAPAIQPSPDAIEEFRVLTNTFDAEYGRNSGSVVNVVTKSGTNEVHGDVYEFLRNDKLDSRGYFDPVLPDYKQNQFGATLGGPIKKDRTFVFGSYEGNRLRQGISSGKVILPTSANATGDFWGAFNADPINNVFGGTLTDQPFANIMAARDTGGAASNCGAAIQSNTGIDITNLPSGGVAYAQIFPNNVIPSQCIDPTAHALYQRYVAPYTPASGCDPVAGCTTATVPVQDELYDQFTVRFDHKINSAQQLSVYYYFTDDNRDDPFSTFQLEAPGGLLPGFGAEFATRVQQWNMGHTWTIGSSAINEFRFNYFREGQAKLDHPLNLLPSIHDACGSFLPAAECFQDLNGTVSSNPSLGITTNLPGHEGVPEVTVHGGFSFGNNFEGELPQVGNTFQWTDNFAKVAGKHSFKFGADVRRQRFDQFVYFETNGYFIYSPGGPDDAGFPLNAYPDYFLGLPNSYNQGAAQREDLRNSALYLFAQDSFKLKTNLTLNYGLRWELNDPYYDTGNRLQTFRPGVATTEYPCQLSANNPLVATYGSTDCSVNGPANAYFPLGLVFPGEKGVPRGLTTTYYKAFAPRLGLAWSPNATDGWLAKLTGGPGASSVRAGFGIFYNPIEELVMEQFGAEPPFGGSIILTGTNFNLPFLPLSSDPVAGPFSPNVFGGVISTSPSTPTDWSQFRHSLLFGELQPHLSAQYAEQYNLTLERQLGKNMVMRAAYVGTQGHHLLATHDLNYGHAETCLQLNNIFDGNPVSGDTCGPFSSDSEFYIPPGTVIPMYTPPPGTPPTKCTGLTLPYNAGSGGNCVPGGTTVGGNGIDLVGLRAYSSPLCQPLDVQILNVGGSPKPVGVGCPADGIPIFTNIFAEDTIVNSNYNGLQFSLERSLSHGLLFQASYTFSKAIDQGASFENALDPLDFNHERGLSLDNARHRFVFSPYWQLPVPQYAGFRGKVADGWGVSAIIAYQSGFPIRMQTQDDQELMSSYNFEDPNTPSITGPVQFQSPKTSADNPNNLYFTQGTFNNISDPGLGTFGNMAHALCCGPGLSNTDLSIEKRTRINERFDTEFRAEFYNAWNHTQFANPDGNFSDLTFGQVVKTREAPRVLQFGLKLLF
jgi:Carboxypeptidase regulatory-like domain/TonB-dependent Receptor Plug Domain